MYFKQIYYEMRHHKMMTWVSISGTALSIFLVMALFMTEQVETIEYYPDTDRSRIMVGKNMHFDSKNGTNGSTAGINADVARRLYEDLDGVEMTARVYYWQQNADISEKGGMLHSVSSYRADDKFWKLYHFNFTDGCPYDENEVNAGAKVAVIPESIARKLFNDTKVAGREMEIDRQTYRIVGVVKDVNPVMSHVFASVYIPYKTDPAEDRIYFGDMNVLLLLKPGVSYDHIKEQVRRRYKALADEAEKEGITVYYHKQPYSVEDIAMGLMGSNNDPNTTNMYFKYILYAVLLLLPAINLSAMTRTRLRRRVAEIGVRRAFGAKKRNIITQALGENLIITLTGGILGLVISILFVLLLSNYFFEFGDNWSESIEIVNARPDFMMLLRWQTFAMALGLCFILNIVSATIPAWRASRENPAEALSSR